MDTQNATRNPLRLLLLLPLRVFVIVLPAATGALQWNNVCLEEGGSGELHISREEIPCPDAAAGQSTEQGAWDRMNRLHTGIGRIEMVK